MKKSAGIAAANICDSDSGQLSVRQKVLVVIGAALGLACGFGPAFFGVSGIFLKPIALSFDWSRADVAVLPMLGMIGTAIGAPIIGQIADRTGWNKVIGFSIMLFPLGLIALSVAPPSHAYIIGVGLLIGIFGAATTAAGYVAVVSSVFDRRLGMALGFTLVGSGVGAMAMPVVAGKLIELMDWRQAYACLAGISLLLGVVAHQIIFRVLAANRSNSDSSSGIVAKAPKDIVDANEEISFAQAIRGYRFWLIAIVAALVAGTTLGTNVHLAAYASDRGVSLSVAAQSVGLLGLGLTLARLVVGLILDRVFAPLVALGAFLLGAAGFYMLTADISQFPWLLPMAAILVGISIGAEGDIIPFMVKKYFGVRAFGSIFGALFAMIVVGGATGAYVFGWLFDLQKSYAPVLQVSAVLCGACSLAILLLGRYPER